ncbi:MAG: hypothetical protein ACRCY8_15040 [Dermatophilaceae bacterium]
MAPVDHGPKPPAEHQRAENFSEGDGRQVRDLYRLFWFLFLGMNVSPLFAVTWWVLAGRPSSSGDAFELDAAQMLGTQLGLMAVITALAIALSIRAPGTTSFEDAAVDNLFRLVAVGVAALLAIGGMCLAAIHTANATSAWLTRLPALMVAGCNTALVVSIGVRVEDFERRRERRRVGDAARRLRRLEASSLQPRGALDTASRSWTGTNLAIEALGTAKHLLSPVSRLVSSSSGCALAVSLWMVLPAGVVELVFWALAESPSLGDVASGLVIFSAGVGITIALRVASWLFALTGETVLRAVVVVVASGFHLMLILNWFTVSVGGSTLRVAVWGVVWVVAIQLVPQALLSIAYHRNLGPGRRFVRCALVLARRRLTRQQHRLG